MTACAHGAARWLRLEAYDTSASPWLWCAGCGALGDVSARAAEALPGDLDSALPEAERGRWRVTWAAHGT